MRLAAFVALLTMTLGTVASAVERGPLPAVDLITRDGATVRADAVAREGKWVIFYLHAACRSCEAVLAAIDGLDAADVARVTIVTEVKDVVELSSAAGRFPRLAGVQWLGDTTGAMGARVAPQVAAAVIGLQGTMIEWSVTGIVTDPAQVRPIVTAWLGR
jgi:hypothetical protein